MKRREDRRGIGRRVAPATWVGWLAGWGLLWMVAGFGAWAAGGEGAVDAERDGRLGWWREARFGLFIHWGPVSLKGTEIGWSRGGERRGYGSRGDQVPAEAYDALYRQFNPVAFQASDWVALAQEAGMRYLVFTSRHHDGFSMFDTRASDYRITAPESPFGRDVVKELAAACREARLRFGLYYSQPDWRHPDAFTAEGHERYLEFLRTQVNELSSRYGRLDVFWFDGLGKPAEAYAGAELVRILRRNQPRILINDRTGLPEDFDTPEQRVGNFRLDRAWETCMTLGDQWAWKPNDRIKTLETCVQTLVACAGGDGNLLFNVGPMPDGRIEPRQVERLQEIGRWLRVHGESIYGTRGGPYQPGRWGASTRRGSRIYLHLFGGQKEVRLPALRMRVTESTILGGGQPLVVQDAEELKVSIPEEEVRPIDTVVVLDIEGRAMDLAPMTVGTPAGTGR